VSARPPVRLPCASAAARSVLPATPMPPKVRPMRPSLLLLLAAACALPAHADDYPKLKSGQWELTTNMGAGPSGPRTMRSTMCTDEAVQQEMMKMGAGTTKEMCTKNETKRDGNRIVGTAECKMGEGTRFTSRSVMTFNGDTSYRTDVTAVYDPPLNGTKESHITLEGRYVGACRDGLVPGDFVGPNGQKFNLKSLGAGKGAVPPPSAQPKSPAKAPQ
jgi:hypothetical protein